MSPWCCCFEGQSVSNTDRCLSLRDQASPHLSGRKHMASRRASRRSSSPADWDFSLEALIAILEEQKIAIARAAGVDPSKVRIQIGH